jgi:hypothetical protein
MQSDLALLPDDERLRGGREGFAELVLRLSRLSVTKHYDAYADMPWDEPACRIDSRDSVWQLDDNHPLGATAWYRNELPETRSSIGLHLAVCAMGTGVHFENVLTRGLLEFAISLPDGAPEFRYAYHEVIEESQHTLMFREFVNRSGLDPGDAGLLVRVGGRIVVWMARLFPELFFLFVLGGEDPIDYVQRTVLRSGREVHPLLRRLMQIHITEEARHLCFARAYLRERVPALGALGRYLLSVAAPLVLGTMARRMLDPPTALARTYLVPRAVLDEAYRRNPKHHAEVHRSLEKVRQLCRDLGLLTRPALLVWRALGIA